MFGCCKWYENRERDSPHRLGTSTSDLEESMESKKMKGRDRSATPSVVAVLLVLLTGVPDTNAQARTRRQRTCSPRSRSGTIPG